MAWKYLSTNEGNSGAWVKVDLKQDSQVQGSDRDSNHYAKRSEAAWLLLLKGLLWVNGLYEFVSLRGDDGESLYETCLISGVISFCSSSFSLNSIRLVSWGVFPVLRESM